MYDKGVNLRFEMTINNPRDFKIFKTPSNQTTGVVTGGKKWVPMGKSIVNLYRYAQISIDVIKRLITALPKTDDSKVTTKEIKAISQRKVINERTYSGFNILNQETLTIFKVIASGDFIINGFTNKSVRSRIYADVTSKTINKVTRLLAKLRAHGIIKKSLIDRNTI